VRTVEINLSYRSRPPINGIKLLNISNEDASNNYVLELDEENRKMSWKWRVYLDQLIITQVEARIVHVF
jgi:hypothetical protein